MSYEPKSQKNRGRELSPSRVVLEAHNSQLPTHFFGLIKNSSCPYSMGWPLEASFFTISPATSDSISLSSFIASTMHSTCPTSTTSPTFTKGGAPGDGAS